jgi:hypothetical protein
VQQQDIRRQLTRPAILYPPWRSSRELSDQSAGPHASTRRDVFHFKTPGWTAVRSPRTRPPRARQSEGAA